MAHLKVYKNCTAGLVDGDAIDLNAVFDVKGITADNSNVRYCINGCPRIIKLALRCDAGFIATDITVKCTEQVGLLSGNGGICFSTTESSIPLDGQLVSITEGRPPGNHTAKIETIGQVNCVFYIAVSGVYADAGKALQDTTLSITYTETAV